MGYHEQTTITSPFLLAHCLPVQMLIFLQLEDRPSSSISSFVMILRIGPFCYLERCSQPPTIRHRIGPRLRFHFSGCVQLGMQQCHRIQHASMLRANSERSSSTFVRTVAAYCWSIAHGRKSYSSISSAETKHAQPRQLVTEKSHGLQEVRLNGRPTTHM